MAISPTFPKPRLNGYGTSFGHRKASSDYGDNLLNYAPEGDIDPSKLNKTKLSDGVEFSPYDEVIKDYVLGMLGHPIVRVELTHYQLKACIDEATTKLSYHAPLWTMQYASFDASVGQNVYELPSYIIDNLSYVVYKKSLLSIQSQAGTLEFDFFLKYFQENYLFENFGVGDFYLLQSAMESTRKILGQEGSYNILNNRFLQLYPAPAMTPERVLIEYRALDSNTLHPAYINWVQRYALAVAKGVLSHVRGKYGQVPSPGGGVTLNSQQLAQEAATEKKELLEELMSQIEEPPVFTAY
tara:strand:+ start:950 stop:1843 length:894 start_codon:yes stop_codon:yes gene_type:complete